jgi:hypothetical protein
MASFEEILNRPASEIKAPQPIPPGTYHCMVEGHPTPEKARTGTGFFRFKYKILAVGEDVDARQAAEQQVVGKIVTHDFFLTDNETTHYILKEFLVETLGIEEGTKHLKELVSEAPNRQLVVKIKHEVSQDGKRAFARVESTARA